MSEKNIYANVADLYDFDPNAVFTDDIPFYFEYATRPGVRTVLELACGTGRVSLPLARSGLAVTGLDLSDAMLAVLEKKLGAEPTLRQNLKLVKGDMSDFALGEKYDLILIPFHAFQVLDTDEKADACLRCIRDHLSDGGVLILDVFRPYGQLDASWVYPLKSRGETVDPSTGHTVRKLDEGYRIDVDSQILYVHQVYQVRNRDVLLREDDDWFNLRYYYYGQITDCIRRNGLTIREEYGWYDKSPITSRKEMIFVCEKSFLR